jgi:NAD(P)-dependent dehydrogenase (short-subunit alcohol dehydrogenase family)
MRSGLAGRRGNVRAIPGDVTDGAHRQALREAAGDGLHLLVNNASELGPSPLRPLVEIGGDELANVLDVNVIAPIQLVRATVAGLEAAGGLVVNVSSDAARGGYEGWGAYGAGKAALELASLTLANELRPRGVGVVTVDPGDMRTAMHQAAFAGQDISDRPSPDVTLPFWAWLLSQPPMAVSGRRFEAQADRWEVAA